MDGLIDVATKAVSSVRAVPEARAGCVVGSLARREHDSASDIDVLIVVSVGHADVARSVRRCMPRQIGGHWLQLRIMTSERLDEIREERTVYAAHVATEAKVSFDRRRDLKRLKRAFPPGSRVEETGKSLRRRLVLYEDLEWCNGHYLACLADLYAFGRAGAILALARQGIFEFGRRTPFTTLGQVAPLLSESCSVLVALEPFYLRGRRDSRVELPFPHRNAHDAVAQARDACARILC